MLDEETPSRGSPVEYGDGSAGYIRSTNSAGRRSVDDVDLGVEATSSHMKPGGTRLPSSGSRGAVSFPFPYQIAVHEAPVFGLCRSIVVSLLVGAVKIGMAAAQPDLQDINTREPGEMCAMGLILYAGAGLKPDGRRACEWDTRAAKLG